MADKGLVLYLFSVVFSLAWADSKRSVECLAWADSKRVREVSGSYIIEELRNTELRSTPQLLYLAPSWFSSRYGMLVNALAQC